MLSDGVGCGELIFLIMVGSCFMIIAEYIRKKLACTQLEDFYPVP